MPTIASHAAGETPEAGDGGPRRHRSASSSARVDLAPDRPPPGSHPHRPHPRGDRRVRPRPHHIATTSDDHTVRIWDLTRPDAEECVAAIDVDFGPGAVALVGDRIVTGHANGAVMVWQLHGG